jgi:hypothetical protein
MSTSKVWSRPNCAQHERGSGFRAHSGQQLQPVLAGIRERQAIKDLTGGPRFSRDLSQSRGIGSGIALRSSVRALTTRRILVSHSPMLDLIGLTDLKTASSQHVRVVSNLHQGLLMRDGKNAHAPLALPLKDLSHNSRINKAYSKVEVLACSMFVPSNNASTNEHST